MQVSPARCGLLSLPEEVLIYIASLYPVKTVFTLEKVCRQWKSVCCSRALWTSILENINVEDYPNLPPGLPFESVPTSCLRQGILSSVNGHDVWVDPNREARLIVKEMQFGDASLDAGPRLLPGGNVLLVIQEGQLKLWMVEPQQCIWAAPQCEKHPVCLCFEYDFINGGDTLAIATVEVDELGLGDTWLRILTYDIGLQKHEERFNNTVPLPLLNQISISGDYLMCPTLEDTSSYFVLNWRKHEKCMVTFLASGIPLYAQRNGTFLAGDTIVTVVEPFDPCLAVVALPLANLTPHFSRDDSWTSVSWRSSSVSVPISHSNKDITFLKLPPVDRATTAVDRPSARGRHHTRRIFAPTLIASRSFILPWSKNAETEVLLFAFDVSDEGVSHLAYHLRLSPDTAGLSKDEIDVNGCPSHNLRLLRYNVTTRANTPNHRLALTNSGHVCYINEYLNCFSLFSHSGAQGVRKIEWASGVLYDRNTRTMYQGPVLSTVDPWSGAIVLSWDGIVKIAYVRPA